MEENKEVVKDKDFDEVITDAAIFDLGYLISVILDYYDVNSSTNEEGEAWKKGTDHDSTIIPKDVDDLVKKAFKTQLKKFAD